MTVDVIIRRAQSADAANIARLIGKFADEALMLRRTPEMVELAIDDYIVGVAANGEIVGCGALKEYSPSVAEIAAIAVSPAVHGKGVGRAIVDAVEALALKRGTYDVFALTLQPAFFSAIEISTRRPSALSGENSARLPGLFTSIRLQRNLLREEPSRRSARGTKCLAAARADALEECGRIRCYCAPPG